MGRTGGGRSSSGRSSGGSRPSSRASGGHRVGGGSSGRRTGSGGSSFRSSSGPSFSTGRSFHRGPSVHYHYESYGGYRRPYRSYGGYDYYRNPAAQVMSTIVAFLMVIIMMFCVVAAINSASGPKNSTPRYKLETHNAFDNNCIDDQLGWFENVSKTTRGLKEFWEETGVQPYILLKDDDGTLLTDGDKQEWAENFYETELQREDAFLYVYFYENGEEYSDVPSYMCYVNGYESSSVMDAEAVQIFWNYIDRYWVTDMSTDQVFINTFTKTADVIMHVSTTGKDIVKWVIIAVVVLIIGIVLIKLSKVWFKDRREKAAEDQRILDTPLGKAANTTESLEDKYLN